jgi:hypothetical protein
MLCSDETTNTEDIWFELQLIYQSRQLFTKAEAALPPFGPIGGHHCYFCIFIAYESL